MSDILSYILETLNILYTDFHNFKNAGSQNEGDVLTYVN